MTSRWFYVLAAAVALGGVGVSAALGVSALIAEVEEMHRFAVPGSATLTLPAGAYTAYFEAEAAHSAEGLGCQVRMGESEVALRPSVPSTQYAVGEYAGTSYFDFDLEAESPVEISCRARAERAGVIAIGQGMGRGWIGMLIGAVACLVVGAGIFFATWFRRSRRKL
jgi:hypothetical protein